MTVWLQNFFLTRWCVPGCQALNDDECCHHSSSNTTSQSSSTQCQDLLQACNSAEFELKRCWCGWRCITILGHFFDISYAFRVEVLLKNVNQGRDSDWGGATKVENPELCRAHLLFPTLYASLSCIKRCNTPFYNVISVIKSHAKSLLLVLSKCWWASPSRCPKWRKSKPYPVYAMAHIQWRIAGWW